MIPVPNPTVFLIIGLIYLLGVLAVPVLLALAASLCWPRSRRHVLARPWRYGLLTLVMLVPVGLMGALWLQEREFAAEFAAREAALNPRLEQPLTLGDLTFPAGSQVKLETLDPLDWQNQPQPHGLESLKEAELPAPMALLGLQVDALDLPTGYDSSRVRLAREGQVDGWPCAAGEWVEFRRTQEDRLKPAGWHFESCPLTPGHSVQGIDWPTGTTLRQLGEHWVLRNDGPADLPFDGLHWLSLVLELDARREPVFWEGELARPLVLGGWHYPVGTRVRHEGDGLSLFSPTDRAVAVREADGLKQGAGRSILQRRSDGQVLKMPANDEVGVIDWMVLE